MRATSTLAGQAIRRGDHRHSGAAPIVAYGEGSVSRLPAHVVATGARRVMLVCGRNSFEASGAVRMMPELEQAAAVQRWSDFAPNPDSSDLLDGLAALREFRPDLVLAVGGGSVMDMAKLLCACAEVPENAVLDAIRAGRSIERRRQKLFLVPTTSGSGAEATHFAVVYIGEDKYSIAGPGLRADAIVLDPALTVSSSRYQRATSGIDAVCQAIESRWAVGATDRSRRFARIALRLLLPALEPFVNAPGPRTARAMCLGSHYAGRAIDISKTTAAHALSYGITKSYGINHGHAVGITLGAFLQEHADPAPTHLRDGIARAAHDAAMADVFAALGATDGQDARRRFGALMVRIGLDPSLTAAGASTAADRAALAASVNTERLGNNPVVFTVGELAGLVTTIE